MWIILAWCAFAIGLVWVGWLIEQWWHWRKPTLLEPPRPSAETPRLWSFVRYQGGGTLKPPQMMTSTEALEFGKSLGHALYVDYDHAIIFYRP